MIDNKLFFDDELISDDEIESLYEMLIEEYNSEEVGYYYLPDGACVKEIVSFCKAYGFDGKGIKNIAVLGIGGSSLGTKAIDALLSHQMNRNGKKLLFFENVDPVEISKNLKTITLEDTFFIVISKSGSTIETTSHLKYLLHHFNITVDSAIFAERFAFVTDENSPLDRFGKEKGVPCFYIPDNVGGRFSVLSPVGLLPLHILGYDISAILSGAKSLVDKVVAKEVDTLCKKAIFYAMGAEERPMNVLFSYANAFTYFNDWYVQLWAESLGKINRDGTKVGLTPIGLIGSIDQHSFLQLVIEGPENKTMTMIKVKDFENPMAIPDVSLPFLDGTDFINKQTFNTLINAQCDATMQSILDQDVPLDLIEIKKLDEKSVGYMILYYELLTSMTGLLLNVNTYDQPGVELGKKILKKKFQK